LRTEGWDARYTSVANGAWRAGQRTDAVVVLVADVQGTSRVHSDAVGCAETRCSTIGILEGGREATRDGGHYTQGGDHADTVVVRVRNKDVAIGCNGKVIWIRKCSRGACAIRPIEGPTASKSGYCAIGENEPDAVVVRVPHIDIPTAIHGYTTRPIKSRNASPLAIGRAVAPSAS